VQAEPGAVGAVPRALQAAALLGGGRHRGHCDTAERSQPRSRGTLAFAALFFAVIASSASRRGHARGRQSGGQRHGWLPQGLGKAFVGRRAALTPLLKLAGSLVELVVGVYQGVHVPHGLQIRGFRS
jgi:hypothetical protein